MTDLKNMFESQKKEIQSVAELANKNAAMLIDMGQRVSRPEVGTPQQAPSSQYGGPQRQNQNSLSKRTNLVIEGVEMDVDLYTYVIKLADAMGIVLYKQDIVQITRIRRRDATIVKPGPLLVSLVHPHACDAFLRNKYKLQGNQEYDQMMTETCPDRDVANKLYQQS